MTAFQAGAGDFQTPRHLSSCLRYPKLVAFRARVNLPADDLRGPIQVRPADNSGLQSIASPDAEPVGVIVDRIRRDLARFQAGTRPRIGDPATFVNRPAY